MTSRADPLFQASLMASATLSSYTKHFPTQQPWLGPRPLLHSLQVRDISGESKSRQFSQAPEDSQDGHPHPQPWLRGTVTCPTPILFMLFLLELSHSRGLERIGVTQRAPQFPHCSRILRLPVPGRAMPSQEYQSWGTGALCLAGSAHCWGWSGRPRHVGEPEAFPDPALSCGLILLSSASYSTREGLMGRKVRRGH